MIKRQETKINNEFDTHDIVHDVDTHLPGRQTQ